MFLGALSGIKVRINHSHMAENPQGLKNKIYYGVRLFLGKLFATDYFACGEDAGIYLFGKNDVENGKVMILPNAIDLNAFNYKPFLREKKRLEAGIKDSTVVIGHVGRFFEQKNHRFLIEIFETFHMKNHDSVLLLFGEGTLRDEITQMVEERGLKDDIRFMGVKADIAEWYQAMDVFVLPSLYEGFPVVGVEAQAAGLPCLFSAEITSEIAISCCTRFISLSQNSKKWADEIKHLVETCSRENAIVDQNRYDITKNAIWLEQFYIGKVDELFR